MKFKDALKKVYKSSRNKEYLKNPFLVYSRISDLVGNSYEDKKKNELFFKIEKEVNLFSLAMEFGLEGKNDAINRYAEVADLLSQKAFEDLADLIYSVVWPETNAEKEKSSSKVIRKIEQTESGTNGNYSSGGGSCFSVLAVFFFLLIGVAVAIVLGFVIFGKHLKWDVFGWITDIFKIQKWQTILLCRPDLG